MTGESRETAEVLAAIHAECFVTPRPWGAGEIAALLTGPGVFLLREGEGFLLGRSVAGETELLTLAVRLSARRGGLGERLVDRFLERARQSGADQAFLEVAADNEPAIALYRKAGFAEVGRRRGYYKKAPGESVDAVVMARSLR